jgi:hypothetical protein
MEIDASRTLLATLVVRFCDPVSTKRDSDALFECVDQFQSAREMQYKMPMSQKVLMHAKEAIDGF